MVPAVAGALFLTGTLLLAQDSGSQPAKPQDENPLTRPLSEKQRKANEKALKQELGKVYKRWLDQDVRWIITDEERAAFMQLSNDEERDQFIQSFWQRRDPTPDTEENEYKEEYYRRIAYANEHFAAGKAGFRTDRGRIYIMFGPPDEIDSHPSGGSYQRPLEEGGGQTSTYPFEVWRYRYIEGVGNEVLIEFVDSCMCNEYHISLDPREKDALAYTPGAGPTWYEELGLANRTDRFTAPNTGAGSMEQMATAHRFDLLEQYAKLSVAPRVKFKDLQEVVTSKLRYNLMPFDVRADFVRITADTVLVPVTVQIKNKDITFVNKDGIQRGVVNIFGRVTTLTGRVAQTFEDTVSVDVPNELLSKTLENSSVYWKALPLRPGRYRFDLVVKDVNGDRLGTWSKGVLVPDFGEEKLASSSLILADLMEPVAPRNVGSGNFVIGTMKVRPRVQPADGKPVTFKRSQDLNFWMQVYNLGVDEKTNKPSATFEYQVVNTANKKTVITANESTSQMGNLGDQVTLEKRVALRDLAPGTYEVVVKVNDNISKQSIAPSAKFVVE